MKNKNNFAKQTMPYILLFMVIMGIMLFYDLSKYTVHDLTYDKFMSNLSDGTVEKIEITPKSKAGVYEITGTLDGYDKNESFKVNTPLSEAVLEKVIKYTDESNIEVKTNENPENSSLVTVLVNIVPSILLIGAVLWLFNKISGSNKNSMDFGRSKAKLNEEAKAHFSDVAG